MNITADGMTDSGTDCLIGLVECGNRHRHCTLVNTQENNSNTAIIVKMFWAVTQLSISQWSEKWLTAVS